MKDIKKKIKKALRNPRLLLQHFSKKDYEWQERDGMKVKKYSTYDEYTKHQRSKLDTISDTIGNYDIQYRETLRTRLAARGVVRPEMNALCLAARIGTEVKAFIDLGCFAVGLDLNPGKANQYVVTGDFHHIQYANHSVDIVFSNSIDHAFDFGALFSEIKRVLKPSGRFILEIGKGDQEGGHGGYYESIGWKRIDEVLEKIIPHGFMVESRTDFAYPWLGEHIVFIRK